MSLRGVPTAGIAPIVTARDSHGLAVATAAVTAVQDTTTGVQAGQPFHLIFEVEAKAGFTLEMDNWMFFDESSTGNRLVALEAITLNGTSMPLDATTIAYHWSGGERPGDTHDALTLSLAVEP
jgi:hypothetical protein